MNSLNKLFLSELADRYDSEKQLLQAMPKMAKTATCKHLQNLILAHLKQTEAHVKKLEKVFQSLDEKPKGRTCEATLGLLKEGDELTAQFKGTPALNASLISTAQKIEHYEIASYGCLHEWAELLENKVAAVILKEILDEEKTANASLIELARSSVNKEAVGELNLVAS